MEHFHFTEKLPIDPNRRLKLQPNTYRLIEKVNLELPAVKLSHEEGEALMEEGRGKLIFVLAVKRLVCLPSGSLPVAVRSVGWL
jgi:hypothetical protein